MPVHDFLWVICKWHGKSHKWCCLLRLLAGCASPSSWVNVTRTSSVTSLISVLLLSYNQFCSGPFPLPIHLTCPYATIHPSPESAGQPQIKSLDLPSFITVCPFPTGDILSSIFSLTCWVQQSHNPLKHQTAVPVINQALVLKRRLY